MRKSLYRLKALSDAIWGAEIKLFFAHFSLHVLTAPPGRSLDPEKPIFHRALMELGRREEQS